MENEFFKEIQEASDKHDRIFGRADGAKNLRSEIKRLDERRYRTFLDEKIRPVLLTFKEYLEKKGHTCEIVDTESGIDLKLHLSNLRNQEDEQYPKLCISQSNSHMHIFATLHAGDNYAGETTVVDKQLLHSEINDFILKQFITKLIIEAYKESQESVI